MTMENGEGRPPDDEATGAEDPQAWYFDLPRGAWERQEQKNRALRERVLGNIAEDAEKAKGDPFVPRPAEPEPPARRGFLAFGRKKKQDDAPRRDDADGSWTLDRPDGMRHQEPTDADAEDDDWSTEIPLRAEPEPPLILRRSVHHEEAGPWGTADAGFVLGSPEAARPVEHTPSAEAGDDGWSGAGSEMPLAEHIEEPAASDRDQAFEETVMPSFSGPQATDVDPNPPDEDFLAGMRSWARGDADSGTTSNEGNAGEERLHTDDVLQLRPRPHDPGEPRLDWSFGPAGWSEPGEQPATSPAAEPQADDEADMIESMRRWAERSKESVHPHFALQHHEEEAELTPEPPPIPLRPRHHDEPWQRPESDGNSEPEPAEPAAEVPAPPAPPPIVLRSRTGEQPAEPEPGTGAPPTRWDEFFGIDRGARPDDDEDEGAGVSEGLAAMRDWARKRAAAEHGGEIPEEFLKPFDWELDESTSQGSDAAALAHEGFAAGPEADGPGAELVLEFAAYLEDAEYRATEEREPTLEFAGEGEAVQRDTDEDPLAGIFGTPPAAAPGVEPREKKRGGMFGRLFGRKKQEDTQAFEVAAPAVAGAAPDGRSDEDIRTVSADAGEWLPYEEADVQAPVVEPDLEPFSASAEETLDADEPAEPWAVPAPFVARAGDDQEGDWAEADEPVPAILPREFVTALERAAPHDQGPAPEVSAYSPEAGDDEFAWEPEPIAFEEPVAQAETTPEEAPATATPAIQLTLDAFAPGEPAGEEPVTDEKPWWEQPVVEEAPAEAVASIAEPVAEEPVTDEKPWWEQPVVEEAPAEAVASTAEPIAEETVADEKPWWELPAAEEAPAEAVAPIAEPVADETVAEEKPWWELPAAEEAPAEAVASIAEPIADEPVTEEKPWWELPAAEEAPAEAVASIAEPIAEETVADEKPWWELPAAEEAPTEAVASVAEPVADETVADEKPWWEQPVVEEVPAEAVASIAEPIAEETVADEKPWWELAAAEEAPAEAVASIAEPIADETVAEEKPLWELPAAEEAPAEAVASIAEPITEETVADEKPWWELPAAEEAPAEAVASIAEPVAEEPVADEKPWWELPAVEEVPAEAVASIEPAAAPDDDDPWADFVSAEPETTAPTRFEPGATHFGPSGTAWEPAPPPAAQPDDDMWGAIAAQAEEAASAPDESHDVDLAASLESRMAAEFDAPPAWETPERYRESTGYDDDSAVFGPDDSEEDVILRAFERHASMPDPEETSNPEAERETQEALAALFGQDASRIVDEAIEEPEPQSFIRMTGFAPQRSSESFDGGWAPQQEVEEAFTHDRVTFGTDGDGFAPPPWATAEFGGEGEATPVEAGSKTRTWIRELVETGLLALLVFLSVRASFQNFKVDGNSMYPTLEDGQFLIVNKLVYSEVDVEKLSKFIPFVDPGDDPKRNVFHGPERGDIVVLRDPRKPETDLIKRVIGLPGETVEIVGGKVYINDRLLEEPYITTPWNDTRPKILIPEGEYYVLGDNRDNSLDSRSSQVGLVPKDLIIGKAMLSYWPRDKFGLAPNEGGSLSDQKPVLTTRQLGED